MLAWMKQNPTLAAGIGLPLVLIVLFSIASAVPNMLVDGPKHDVLFYAQTYVNKPGTDVTLSVVNGRLKAQYKKRTEQYGGNTENLYLYSAKSGTVKQINVTPPDAGTDNWQDFVVPEVSNLTLDTNLTAPDGYTYESYRTRYSSDVGSLFFMGSYRSNGPVLSKDGRTIPLNPVSGDYYGHSPQFLGWIRE